MKNIQKMKRKIIIAISFVLITLSFSSCEPLGTCKICRRVTYAINGGTVISEDPETEYCDADLLAIEAKADVITPWWHPKISWECR